MRIKNRLFPYPLMHKNILESSFKSGTFDLNIETRQDGVNYVITVTSSIGNDYIKGLIQNGRAKTVCVVECPQAMYRQHFLLTEEKQIIEVPLFDLIGQIEISGFIYTTEKIDDYAPTDLLDDYIVRTFSIDKHCIISVNNGVTQKISFDDLDDTKKKSIFILVCNLDPNCRQIEWSYDNNFINIYIPEYQYREYESLKHFSGTQKSFITLFALAPLSMILAEFIKTEESLEDLKYQYRWFNAFCKAVKEINNKEITDEDFQKMDNSAVYELVQRVFDYCLTDSIDEIFELCNGIGGYDEN